MPAGLQRERRSPSQSAAKKSTTVDSPEGAIHAPLAVPALQQTLGNQAVQRLAQTGRLSELIAAGGFAGSVAAQRQGHFFQPRQGDALDRLMAAEEPGKVQTSPLPIQRSLRTGQRFLQQTDQNDVAFQAIAQLLDDYNAMCGFFVRVTTDVANRRFAKLQQIDRAIYAWFDQVSANHEQLSASPHTPVLKQLLVDSDEEHVALIDKTKKKPGVLPFDTSALDQNEVQQLTALWRSLVRGEGKIQLLGDKSYRKRMLSDLAKILNTATGRKLLAFLNTEPQQEQDDGTRNLLTNIYIGQRTGQLPTSVTSQLPSQLQDSGVSRSQPLDDSKAYMQDPVNLNGAQRPQGFYGALTRRGFQTAVLTEKEGVVYQGKKYEFGEGTGAFVHVETGGGPSSLTGSPGQDSEIISPRFITLAHELGHSANQRAGAGTAGAMGRYDDLFTMSGNPTDVAKTDWDDPEEMLNILNVENAVRSESGLVDRTSHKTPEGLKRSRRILNIRQQVTAQFGVADRPDSYRCFDRASLGLWFTATGDALGRELVRVRNSLENDGHWNTVRGLLQNFLAMNAGNEKTAFVQAAFVEMNRLVGNKGGRDALKPTDQGKFDTVTTDVNNNLGGIVGNAANYLQLLDRIFGIQLAAGGRVDFVGNGQPLLNWN